MELIGAFVLGVITLFALARPETLEEQAERLAKKKMREAAK